MYLLDFPAGSLQHQTNTPSGEGESKAGVGMECKDGVQWNPLIQTPIEQKKHEKACL